MKIAALVKDAQFLMLARLLKKVKTKSRESLLISLFNLSLRDAESYMTNNNLISVIFHKTQISFYTAS